MMLKPLLARAVAMPWPMPLVEPVTSAILLVIVIVGALKVHELQHFVDCQGGEQFTVTNIVLKLG